MIVRSFRFSIERQREASMKKQPEDKNKQPVKKAVVAKKVISKQLPADTHSGKEGSAMSCLDAALPADLDRTGFPIVALGASAGGLEALEAFFKALDHESGMAFVIVVHLDPTHTSLLPELLKKHTKMPVHQICDGMQVHSNHVFIIPPNKNLTILNGILQLMDIPDSRGVKYPIDLFFRALAEDQGCNAVGIILSGAGTDGTEGLKAIRNEMGLTMVQDEESAKYDGMPGSAISAGLADYVLPPGMMPAHLLKNSRHRISRSRSCGLMSDGEIPNALQKICAILRMQTDHDFSLYKKNTICRRVERRMSVHHINDIDEYVNYLQNNEREVDILFNEMLIGVTNFFRDAEGFDLLRDKIIPDLLEGKPDNYTIRVWVAGCSSGEEAYSLAIILQESMDLIQRHFNVQIFGTDIDETAIAYARAGVYPESIEKDVSPERLKRYFKKNDDGRYRIKTSIREMIVFALQNVTQDPPFTKLDMLSCRNLLIYLDSELQKKLLPVFHYSLHPEGILFLGSSESIGTFASLFSTLNKKWKIFQRKELAAGLPPGLNMSSFSESLAAVDIGTPNNIRKTEALSAMKLVETILKQSDTPPCVIIDDACNVVYIHGRTGRFLEPAEGKITANILGMARPALRAVLASAIHSAAQQNREVICRGVRLGYNRESLFVDVTVKPILEQTIMRGLMMVVFKVVAKPVNGNNSESCEETESAKTAEELEQELRETKEDLQATIEELETAYEEIKSSNEELQSTNEELQSTNEEMETSKEELQSLNEEASTVNAELQGRIEDLSNTNDDIKNLLDSTDIATVLLDVNLGIRRFTPRVTDLIPLTGTDAGRPINHFLSTLIDVDLAECGRKVLKELTLYEVEVRSKDESTYIMKVRPYRTVHNAIEGVVITFEQITALKQAEEKLQEAEMFCGSIMQAASDGMVVLDAQGVILDANPAYCRMTGYTRDELLHICMTAAGGTESEADLKRLLTHESCRFETSLHRKDGGLIKVEVSRVIVQNASQKCIVSIREIKERRESNG